MMRLLFIHTSYLQKGGEDAVFLQEVKLAETDQIVQYFTFSNRAGFKGAIQFLCSIWNINAARRLNNIIKSFKPDIIHFHNLHFALGPLAIRTAKKSGLPVIVTLHNYRLLCPSATLFYNHHLFLDSIKRTFPWLAIKKGVYRNSVIQTFWLAVITWFHKKAGTWNMVDNYIVLTDFAKEQFTESNFGVPDFKFIVKPNFVEPTLQSFEQRKDHFLFIGRLSEEKGIQMLIETFANSGFKLQVAGDGPLLVRLKELSKGKANITYLGTLNSSQIEHALKECSALIFPSLWYEGMPMTILEAFANGTPVIASNLGAMSTMITDEYNGLHFTVNDKTDLLNKLNYWDSLTQADRKRYYEHAYHSYLDEYTPLHNKAMMLSVYRQVVKHEVNTQF